MKIMANINRANEATRELNRIANAYAVVFNNKYIESDMAIYAKRIPEYAECMNAEEFNYDYTETFYIRTRGVETDENRVGLLGDKVIAVVTIKYDKVADGYEIMAENRF